MSKQAKNVESRSIREKKLSLERSLLSKCKQLKKECNVISAQVKSPYGLTIKEDLINGMLNANYSLQIPFENVAECQLKVAEFLTKNVELSNCYRVLVQTQIDLERPHITSLDRFI